ncbi:type II secretion system F family protein [Nocardia sp. NPDC060249]|uniref:type II secretion system F family protein n=1 Tax=Nocardia sp. NPDC060249 TaxID=3347082 RepID=UPI003646F289
MDGAVPPGALLIAAVAIVLLPGRVAVSRRVRALGPTTVGVSGVPGDTAKADPLGSASAFDLLAACLRAGLPMAAAARAAAPTAPPVLRAALLRAADLLALGADAATAWERAVADAAGSAGADDVESLARMARRSARSGASLAAAVGELATQRREAVEDAAVARAERAGVLIGGPLGLCFLPAFVCLGIVPVVIGLADRVLGGGGLL